MGNEKVMLPPRLFKIVEVVLKSENGIYINDLARQLNVKESDIMRDLAELEVKGMIRLEKVSKYFVKLSDLGRKYLSEGLPEEKVLSYLTKVRRAHVNELKEVLRLSEEEVSAALGLLRRYKLVSVSGGFIECLKCDEVKDFIEYVGKVRNTMINYGNNVVLDSVPDDVQSLRRRKVFEISELKIIKILPTETLIKLKALGLIAEANVVTKLTSEMLISGSWRNVILKEFDLSIDVPKKSVKRKHPYIQFMNYVKEVLVGMGFEEVKGPFLETALWNFDVLFVPQYHPARRVSDVFYVSNVLVSVNEVEVLNKVKEIHENCWKYSWNVEEALKTILRTHTTPVSMRTIYAKKGGEYRVFSFDRVFRPDTPDPTHLMEFHQLEGIIVGRNVTFKHLLGFFKEFARYLGMNDVKFKPAYFPFTEPSVEGFVKHPRLGWIEVFPGGMFRPEVTEAVGLPPEYKVAAWGIGIDRLAMIVLGLDDIRDLYTHDLDIIDSLKLPEVVVKRA